MAARLYFEFDGVAYRVHDTYFTQGKQHCVPLGDAKAKTRVFVPESGAHRIYTFRKDEARGVTEAELERQLRSSGYAATEKFDTSRLTSDSRPPYNR